MDRLIYNPAWLQLQLDQCISNNMGLVVVGAVYVVLLGAYLATTKDSTVEKISTGIILAIVSPVGTLFTLGVVLISILLWPAVLMGVTLGGATYAVAKSVVAYRNRPSIIKKTLLEKLDSMIREVDVLITKMEEGG